MKPFKSTFLDPSTSEFGQIKTKNLLKISYLQNAFDQTFQFDHRRRVFDLQEDVAFASTNFEMQVLKN